MSAVTEQLDMRDFVQTLHSKQAAPHAVARADCSEVHAAFRSYSIYRAVTYRFKNKIIVYTRQMCK